LKIDQSTKKFNYNNLSENKRSNLKEKNNNNYILRNGQVLYYDFLSAQYLYPYNKIKSEKIKSGVPLQVDLEDLPGKGGIYNFLNLDLYNYSHGNPIINTDPDGNVLWFPVIIVVVIVAVIVKGCSEKDNPNSGTRKAVNNFVRVQDGGTKGEGVHFMKITPKEYRGNRKKIK